MISLCVTADTKNYNVSERDKLFGEILASFKEPFEIIYVTTEDYGYLEDLRNTVKGNENRHLIINTPDTNINTQIYSALRYTDNGDVLLCTLDTNAELLKEVLTQHIKGADLVYVKKKENPFKAFFVGLGKVVYRFGLMMLGRGRDLCCESRVMYLNNRSVNTIVISPTLSKALMLVNPDPDKEMRVVTSEKVYDNPTTEQKSFNTSFFALGTVSFVYFLALFVMAIVFPLCNNGVYTWWILGIIILWLVLGIVGATLAAKSIYSARLNSNVAVDLTGEPILKIKEIIAFDDIPTTPQIKSNLKTAKKPPQEIIVDINNTDRQPLIPLAEPTNNDAKKSIKTEPKKRGRPKSSTAGKSAKSNSNNDLNSENIKSNDTLPEAKANNTEKKKTVKTNSQKKTANKNAKSKSTNKKTTVSKIKSTKSPKTKK